MNGTALKRALGVGLAAVLINLPSTASACSVCMGNPNSKEAGAINAAIFLMLGFIGAMLAFIGAFGVYLVKRAHAPVPTHSPFVESDSCDEPQEEK